MEFVPALSLLYLIIMVKYFDPMISCDVQRFFTENILAKHVLAFVAIFFLVVLAENPADRDPNATIWDYVINTAQIYGLFVLSTKGKAMFAIPVLIFIAVDRFAKLYIDIESKKSGTETMVDNLKTARGYFKYIIFGIIGAGAASYFMRQREMFGSRFSVTKFFVGTFKCKQI